VRKAGKSLVTVTCDEACTQVMHEVLGWKDSLGGGHCLENPRYLGTWQATFQAPQRLGHD